MPAPFAPSRCDPTGRSDQKRPPRGAERPVGWAPITLPRYGSTDESGTSSFCRARGKLPGRASRRLSFSLLGLLGGCAAGRARQHQGGSGRSRRREFGRPVLVLFTGSRGALPGPGCEHAVDPPDDSIHGNLRRRRTAAQNLPCRRERKGHPSQPAVTCNPAAPRRRPPRAWRER